jgi:hypothetical protein
MKFLLRWEQDRTPELHATQYLPVFVDPAQAFFQIVGDLLWGHYFCSLGFVNHIPVHGDDLGDNGLAESPTEAAKNLVR